MFFSSLGSLWIKKWTFCPCRLMLMYTHFSCTCLADLRSDFWQIIRLLRICFLLFERCSWSQAWYSLSLLSLLHCVWHMSQLVITHGLPLLSCSSFLFTVRSLTPGKPHPILSLTSTSHSVVTRSAAQRNLKMHILRLLPRPAESETGFRAQRSVLRMPLHRENRCFSLRSCLPSFYTEGGVWWEIYVLGC